jgi:hypothetical protein
VAEASGAGAASDPGTLSELTADDMRAHADYGAGALIACLAFHQVCVLRSNAPAVTGLDLLVVIA